MRKLFYEPNLRLILVACFEGRLLVLNENLVALRGGIIDLDKTESVYAVRSARLQKRNITLILSHRMGNSATACTESRIHAMDSPGFLHIAFELIV